MGSKSPSPTVFGHPRELFHLFFAEMWERFSYFGLRALLILYLVDHWRMADSQAAALYGAYTSLAFGAAIPGGMIADRLLGLSRSLLCGGFLIMLGHIALALHELADRGQVDPVFLLGLSLIVVGTGLFKPAVATQVGALYPAGDPRRESGFYIFYVGINIGAALAPLVCGYLGEAVGWSWGFGAAAVGMALGLATVARHARNLPEPAGARSHDRPVLAIVCVSVLGTAATFLLLKTPLFVGAILAIALVAGLAVVGRFVLTEASREERRHVVAALCLVLAAVVYWSLSQQGGSTLNLFAARAVDLHIGPVKMTAAQTQFFAPFFIVVGAPLFAWLWRSLAKWGREPSTPWKFALGLAFGGGGFGVLVLAAISTSAGAKVALPWLVCTYALHTVGELMLATPGVAAITRLAPARISTLIMGIWLFSVSAGNFVGAAVAARAPAGNSLGRDPASYSSLFLWVAAFALVAAVIMALSAPLLRRLSR